VRLAITLFDFSMLLNLDMVNVGSGLNCAPRLDVCGSLSPLHYNHSVEK
jgi:hypothetical protein